MTRTAAASATLAAVALLASCTSRGAPAANADPSRAAVVQRFVDQPVPPTVHWTRHNSPLGNLWNAYYPGVGMFTLDPTGRLVLTAVFAQPTTQPRIPLAPTALLHDAEHFITAHRLTLARMALYRDSEHDDGAQILFTATWRERRGATWLPALISVTLTAAGLPVSFTHNPTTTAAVDTTPKVSAATARATVIRAARGHPIIGSPELDVIGPPAQPPRLVWIFTVSASTDDAVPNPIQVAVDAETGHLIS